MYVRTYVKLSIPQGYVCVHTVYHCYVSEAWCPYVKFMCIPLGGGGGGGGRNAKCWIKENEVVKGCKQCAWKTIGCCVCGSGV